MTKEGVLHVINKVFGAEAWASVGFWNVLIETQPRREIVFTADWVHMHIDSDTSTLSPNDLEVRLRMLSDDDWHLDKKTGGQFCLIR